MTTETINTTTTVTVTLDSLRDALEWVTPSMSKDAPALKGMHVRVGGDGHAPHYGYGFEHMPSRAGSVSFAATDRYRLAYSTLKADSVSDEGVCVWLPVAEVKAIGAAVKSWGKRVGYMVRVTVDDLYRVTLELVPSFASTAEATLVQHGEAPDTFPRYASLIPTTPVKGAADDEGVFGFALNGGYLSDFGKAAARISDQGTLRILPTARHKVIGVATVWVSDAMVHHSGIVMPVRLSNE